MRGSLGFFNKQSLFTSVCETAHGKYEPHIHRHEASFVTSTCENELRKNIITCKDGNQEAFLAEVGGLGLNTELSLSVNDLPPYIPVVDRPAAGIVKLPDQFPVIGLTASSVIPAIYFQAGAYREMGVIRFRKNSLKHPFYSGKTTVLFFSGPDTLIENLWYNRDNCRLFENIRKIGFELMTGINFSLFKGECPFAHALNLKKSLHSCFLAEQANLATIPHVYCLHKHHVQRWINWFKQNDHIEYFIVNCQLQKNSIHDLETVVKTTSLLLNELPHLHVLFQGFPLTELYRFSTLIPRIHIADAAAWKFALAKQRIQHGSNSTKFSVTYDGKASTSDLFLSNLETRLGFLTHLLHAKKDTTKALPY